MTRIKTEDVEWLRKNAHEVVYGLPLRAGLRIEAERKLNAAADTIERLREENARYREALVTARRKIEANSLERDGMDQDIDDAYKAIRAALKEGK